MSGIGDATGERIGDHEREAAQSALTTHREQGRLDPAAFEDRQVRAGRAQTWGDLVALFSDLPEPRPAKVTALLAYTAPGRPLPSRATAPAIRRGLPVSRWQIRALTPLVVLVIAALIGWKHWQIWLVIPIVNILLGGPNGWDHRGGGRGRRNRP